MRRGGGRLALTALVAAAALSGLGAASDPAERLPDPAQEARARDLFRAFRCIVCQNESIDDSEADLAADLRRIVRRRISEGQSDAQVRAYMVSRYGEFVLLKPPFSAGNALLWLTPLLIVGLGGGYLVWLGRRPRTETEDLSDDERRALTALQGASGPPGATVPPHSRNNKPTKPG